MGSEKAKQKIIELYNLLLSQGMSKENYYHLISLMDAYGIERDESVRIINGVVKFPVSFADGYC